MSSVNEPATCVHPDSREIHEVCTCSRDQSSVISFSTTQSSIQISSTQDDVTLQNCWDEAAFPGDARTEAEALEQQIDETIQERMQQALEMQRFRERFNELAPMLGYNFLPPAVKVLKLIGILYWTFFVVRFLCLADLNLLICLLGSVSLICLTFAFATEQHLFFWPFAFVCILEILNSTVQFISLSLLIYRSDGRIAKIMNELAEHEELFGNSLLDEMQTWDGVATVELYLFIKLIVFPIAFSVCAQVARIFYDKDDILQAQNVNTVRNELI